MAEPPHPGCTFVPFQPYAVPPNSERDVLFYDPPGCLWSRTCDYKYISFAREDKSGLKYYLSTKISGAAAGSSTQVILDLPFYVKTRALLVISGSCLGPMETDY